MRFLEDIFLSLWSLRSSFSRVGVILPDVLSSRQYLTYVKAALAALFLLQTYSGVSAVQTQYTIWPSTAVPGNLDVGPDSPVELGISFKSDLNGYITGIRFYKGSNNTGTHVGNLWNSAGTLLASATFANETASGWQQLNFSAPVAITANTIYRASYDSTITTVSPTATLRLPAPITRLCMPSQTPLRPQTEFIATARVAASPRIPTAPRTIGWMSLSRQAPRVLRATAPFLRFGLARRYPLRLMPVPTLQWNSA